MEDATFEAQFDGVLRAIRVELAAKQRRIDYLEGWHYQEPHALEAATIKAWRFLAGMPGRCTDGGEVAAELLEALNGIGINPAEDPPD